MDDAILSRLRRTSRGFPAALAVVAPDGLEVVRHGCFDGADFEIGSISKGVTGLLYVDAVARGEVNGSTRLSELLPVGDGPVGAITLESLALHRSGLPRVVGRHVTRRSLDYLRHGTDPFAQPLPELFADASRARVGRSRPRYSNAGFQLLGHALATASGVSYADLIATRIAEPLDLSPFYVPDSPADLLPGAVEGHNRGKIVDPWASEAIGPAGGVRASVEAMAAFVRAMLAGTAPGVAALDPVADFSGPAMRIGAGWMTTDMRAKGLLTWHNGGTGGHRSWLGMRRDLGLGVVALAATTASVDDLGLNVIDERANQFN